MMTKLPQSVENSTLSGAEKQLERVLLIGYGNLSRRDDGVALHVLQRLRQRLGLPPEELGVDAEIEPGTSLAMMCVHQLAPELADTACDYDVVVYIDAHVSQVDWEPVRWAEIEAAYQSGMVGHHLKPGVILALCESLYGKNPAGYMLSILAHDFDFGEGLSAETSALADQAVDELEEFLRARGAIGL